MTHVKLYLNYFLTIVISVVVFFYLQWVINIKFVILIQFFSIFTIITSAMTCCSVGTNHEQGHDEHGLCF